MRRQSRHSRLQKIPTGCDCDCSQVEGAGLSWLHTGSAYTETCRWAPQGWGSVNGSRSSVCWSKMSRRLHSNCTSKEASAALVATWQNSDTAEMSLCGACQSLGNRDLEKGDSRLFNEECNCCVYVSAYQLITSNKVKYILKGLTQVLWKVLWSSGTVIVFCKWAVWGNIQSVLVTQWFTQIKKNTQELWI